MFTRILLYASLLLCCCPGVSRGQQTPAATQASSPANSPANALGQEFPVVLQHKVVAGKTSPGTHVQANLVVATLLNGKVIPRNAVLSGEVIESKAKTSSEPSRLSIRMDSAQWKNGSAPVQVYLTPRFYPVTLDAGPNLQYGPEQSAKRSWNGMGEYPSDSPTYKPFPNATDTAKSPSSPTAPSPVVSQRPVNMKDVACQRDSAGVVTLVGNRSNIKLDNLTTYVFGSSDLAMAGAK